MKQLEAEIAAAEKECKQKTEDAEKAARQSQETNARLEEEENELKQCKEERRSTEENIAQLGLELEACRKEMEKLLEEAGQREADILGVPETGHQGSIDAAKDGIKEAEEKSMISAMTSGTPVPGRKIPAGRPARPVPAPPVRSKRQKTGGKHLRRTCRMTSIY